MLRMNRKIGLLLSTMLSACSQVTPSATNWVIIDRSASFAGATTPEVFDKAIASVEADVSRMLIGDGVSIFLTGDRESTRMLSVETFELTRSLRPNEAALKTGQSIRSAVAGAAELDQGTALIFSLRRSGIKCAQGGRDQVTIVSDLLEDVEVDIAAQITQGRVALPKPDTAFLQNCRVIVHAAAMTAPGKPQYTNREVGMLIAAWETYLHEAGASDVVINTYL